MASRMERYTAKQDPQVASRTAKNQKVYDDLYTNATVTNFSTVEANVIDLSQVQEKGLSRREAYQKSRGAASFGTDMSDVREARDYEYDYSVKEEMEPKDFDINRVLEEARKNREDDDELERRRRLKTTEYNILTDLNEEKLKEYQNNKKEVLSQEEEKNLEELIHTITSKTMSHDVNEILEREKNERKKTTKQEDYLLDDLMPTKFDETIITGDLAEQLEESSDVQINISESVIETITKPIDKTSTGSEDYGETVIDRSFYTKSMDLSKEDLVGGDEDNVFADDTKTSPWIKIIVTILVLSLIVAIGFVVYQYILK